MSKRPKTPTAPPAWEIARRTNRTEVMYTRIHGQVSRRTERRKAKQRGWHDA